MKTLDLAKKLDTEFEVSSNTEDLIGWAVTDDNRKYINSEFLNKKTGLILKSSEVVEKVYTTVFVTDYIVEKVIKNNNGLIFTHHQFDYYENESGLQPIKPEIIEKLIKTGNSIYIAHAVLDTHKKYGTSVSLAKINNINIDLLFYDYFGAPTAVVGHVKKQGFDEFAENVRKNLSRPFLTLEKNNPFVEKIAVVAGGGDMPDILQQVYDYNCDTLLTGTIENRWAVPYIQELNKKFHDLNKDLKRNLIGGTHFGTERPAMLYVLDLFKEYNIPCEYCEDELLLKIL